MFASKKVDSRRQVLPWVAENAEPTHGLRRLEWDSIYKNADEKFKDRDLDEAWSDVAYTWLITLKEDLGEKYSISESNNFMLLSSEDSSYNKALLNYLEVSRRRILRFLAGIANDEGYGKFVVMVYEDNSKYHDYISFFGRQEGTSGMSGGMFIYHGYGHLVFPFGDIQMTELVAGHEMSHALVSHLQLPVWLDEGIAVNMEGALKGFNSSPITHDLFEKHQSFWNESNIQEFWFGESFSRADEGQELSYQLARILVSNLSEQFENFVGFCNRAQWQDAGDGALLDIYGLSLQDLIYNFIGDGDWQPKPQEMASK